METKHTCPECNLIFEAALPETGLLNCPLCNNVFAERMPLPNSDRRDAGPTVASGASAASGRQVLRGVLAISALLFLAGGLVYAYYLLSSIGQKTTPAPAANPEGSETSRSSTQPPAVFDNPADPAPLPPAAIVPQRAPYQPPRLQPIAIAEAPRRPLTLAERVNEAIDRGVAFLGSHHRQTAKYRRYMGLLGLTLLECGIPADDPAVKQIAAWIRAEERDLMQTYDLMLAILFLDRLGEARDQPLIRTFGQRLLDGQLDCGAWTYSCLGNVRLRGRRNTRAGLVLPEAPPGQLGGQRPRIAYHGDNSNTQFAILGLWVAQRHGVASRAAILETERYFRSTQQRDGSWAYHPNARNWRDSMTCAGLMSLAMRYGVINRQGGDIRPRQPLLVHDAAVEQGLRYLAGSLDKVSLVGGRIDGVEARDPLYFLWSLERMAVIYDLKKIGNREWYPWAAEMLVETQRPDGAWQGMGEPISTCFALLILKRSNFAKDLQLAVQEPPARPFAGIAGPNIRQGTDAMLGLTGKAPVSPAMPGTAGDPRSAAPLRPPVARSPAPIKKATPPAGGQEVPLQK